MRKILAGVIVCVLAAGGCCGTDGEGDVRRLRIEVSPLGEEKEVAELRAGMAPLFVINSAGMALDIMIDGEKPCCTIPAGRHEWCHVKPGRHEILARGHRFKATASVDVTSDGVRVTISRE
ncbi:MAG: hypothetical protein ACYTAF_06670 [Planctomycetota bacterium]|jgi:hypothetical protein